MAINSLTDIQAMIMKKVISDQEGKQVPYAWDLADPVDASSRRLGDLFEQKEDFFICLPEVDEEAPLVGYYTPADVTGAVEFYYCTRNKLDGLKARRALETLCRIFSHRTIEGVQFRGINPGRAIPYRNFTLHPGEVPLQAKLKIVRES